VASALNQLGWVCAHLGEYTEALAHCEAALPIHRAADNAMPASLAETFDSIGFIHERRGAPAEAATAYRESAELFEELGYAFEAAVTLERLGGVLADLEDHAAARQAWERALEIFRARGLTEADALKQRLDALPG